MHVRRAHQPRPHDRKASRGDLAQPLGLGGEEPAQLRLVAADRGYPRIELVGRERERDEGPRFGGRHPQQPTLSGLVL